MENEGWRTLIIDNRSKMSLEEGLLKVEGEETNLFPIDQLRLIMVGPTVSGISAPLLCALARQNVRIVVCNEKHDPALEVQNFESNGLSSGKLFEQIKWQNETKQNVWQTIVKSKIAGQIGTLETLGIEVPDKLRENYEQVRLNDLTNREGQAARIYFNRLFGYSFSRQNDDGVNAALNYGYAIIRSYLNRLITIHGYDTRLGIKHCSVLNPYNLTCDLMEPFRPVVDRIVYDHPGQILDAGYRKELVSTVYTEVRYGGELMELHTAMDLYVTAILKMLGGKEAQVKELKQIA